MKVLTPWLRHYLPVLEVDDAQLAEDLTLRGIAVEGVFELNDAAGDSDGALFDMDITTNRVDAMNHYGIAREIAAIYDVPLHPLDTGLPTGNPRAEPFPVKIEATDLCGRFTARVVRDVMIAPSEGRLAHWFGELGQRPISNAVDATNFALLGMGHPTHAFDLDKITGGITVRRARAGESLKLLDGTTRTLVEDDLVVADDVKALGLAGVMGGWDTMITPATKNVLVEAAWFDPASIRASSRRHLLHTDASHRFERGADFAATPIANALVTKGILEACGGYLDGELVDVVVPEFEAATVGRAEIALSVSEVQRHLGTTLAPEGITADLIERYLTALGCRLSVTGTDTDSVTLPSWRLDLTREIDLVEEIARVYGYNKFANTLPTPGVTIEHPVAKAERAVRTRLLALGFSEAISSTFCSAADASFFATGGTSVALENPLSEEASDLRPTLTPGMVGMLINNLNRGVESVRLFEAGTVFAGSTERVDETLSLALGMTGATSATALFRAEDAAFYELKGAMESVAGLFVHAGVRFSDAGAPGFLEAGRAACAWIGERRVAWFGQLAGVEAARRKLRQPVWLAEIDLEHLLTMPLRRPVAKEISKFQAVERDFSFTFADAVTWDRVAEAVRGLGIAELQQLWPVEIFRDAKGKAVASGHYSLLLRTVFQSAERTLREEDLAGWSAAIVGSLTALGGTQRA
jgi:phenylalanyl-tRNA synthetase beta chain